MAYLFTGDSANEVWKAALTEIRDGKDVRVQAGRGGKTWEIDQAFFAIRDPRQRWVAARQPPLNPAFAIAEVVWILNGRKNSAFLNFWNSQLPKYAGNAHEYHGAYGFRLRQHFGIDQLERAYLALKNNMSSRQVVLQIWDSKVDLPDEKGHPVNRDIPCNVLALLKVRDGKLNWTQVIRSNDLFRGVPYNFIQFTSLHEVLSGWLSVELGSYNQLSDSLHIYESDFKYIDNDCSVDIQRNTESISFPKKVSEVAFSRLAQCMDAMLSPALSRKELYNLVIHFNFPVAFQNMLLAVASEAARRRGWLDVAQDLMTNCSNAALTQVCERWLANLNLRGTPVLNAATLDKARQKRMPS